MQLRRIWLHGVAGLVEHQLTVLVTQRVGVGDGLGHHRLGGVDRGLVAELRRLRQTLAAAQQVPAYIVFGDATLRALAGQRPASVAALEGITGIGAKKREAYGDAVLAVIAAAG